MDDTPISSGNDDWQQVVKTFTGYEAPKVDTIFKDLTGNDDIPMMSVTVEKADYSEAPDVDDVDWWGKNVVNDIGTMDITIPFYVNDDGLVMHEAKITLLGIQDTEGARKNGGGSGTIPGEDETEDKSWDSHPLAQYSFGTGHALDWLLTKKTGTRNFDWGNGVPDGEYVDLSTFEATAQAFDRVQNFVIDQKAELDDWEKILGGKENENWQGQAAGVWWNLVHLLARRYDRLGDDMENTANKTVGSKQGAAVRYAGEVFTDEAQNLYEAWDDWASWDKGNPLFFLNRILWQVMSNIFDNNLYNTATHTSSNPSGSDSSGRGYKPETESLVAGPNFDEDARDDDRSYGKLKDMTTWKAIGEEAKNRWWRAVREELGIPAETARRNVINAWNSSNLDIGDIRPPSGEDLKTSLQEDQAAKDKRQAAKDKAEQDRINKENQAKMDAYQDQMAKDRAADKAEQDRIRKEQEAKADKQRAEDLARQKAEQDRQDRIRKEQEEKADKQRAEDLARQKEQEAEQERKQKEQEAKQEQKEKEQEAKQEQKEKEQEQKQQEQEAKQEQKEKEQEAKQEQKEKEQEQKQQEQEAKQEQKEKEQEAKQEEQQRKQEQMQILQMQQQKAQQDQQKKDQEKKEKEQEAKQEEQERKQEERQEEQDRKQEELRQEQKQEQKEQEAKQEAKEKEQEAKQEQQQKEQEKKQEEQERKQEERQEEQDRKQEQQQQEQEERQEEQDRKQEQQQQEQKQEQKEQEAKQEQQQKDQETKQEQEQRRQEQRQDEQQKHQEQRQDQQQRRQEQRQDEQQKHQEEVQRKQELRQQQYQDKAGDILDRQDGSNGDYQQHLLNDISGPVNGDDSLTNPGGSHSYVDSHGRVVTDYPDQSSSRIDPQTQTSTITDPDGTTHSGPLNAGDVLTNPDGSVSHLDSQGQVVTEYSDGSRTTVDPHTGATSITSPDGTTTSGYLNGGTGPDAPQSGGGSRGGLGSYGGAQDYEQELYDPQSSDYGGQQGAGSAAASLGGSSAAAAGGSGGTPMSPGMMGGGGMGGMGGGGGGGRGGEGGATERARNVFDSGDVVSNRRRPANARAGGGRYDEREAMINTSSGSPYGTHAGGGQGGGPGQQQTQSGDREREAWVPEDEDVWGSDEGGAPAVIGR
ncbi:AAWKG family protein [Streptomyces tsukubensis]|uniref:Microtubule/TRAF3 and DISC1 binding protein n=1 Tax=Streptomyces tsukubensis TaxID=83656 RepID=A0A1V4ABS6_9ACTN|nr:AAWKG family protein [Streptomyces tsukubensis]OON81114.1 hypothetical protein B1H18_09960 [Streptomyces tsukubensis]